MTRDDMEAEDPTPRRYSRDEVLEMAKERKARRSERLERIKQEAIAAGKEPFDLDRFDELYQVPFSKHERTRPREERLKGWETQYFIVFGDRVKSVEEFVAAMVHDEQNWT